MQNNGNHEVQPLNENLSLIESVDIDQVQHTMQKIRQFQRSFKIRCSPIMIMESFPEPKPTLLEAGSRKNFDAWD